MKRTLILSALAAALLVAAGCNNSSFYGALGNKVTVTSLRISPSTATVPVNGSIAFSANGGAPPYVFSMVSGAGSINSSTGAYLASAAAGTETVQVKDKQGTTASAAVIVSGTTGPLAITPSSVSINAGGTITFVATGGTPPYTFSLTGTGSNPPMPTINAGTGAYAAGSTVGSDTVRVTDNVGATSNATVTVTAAVTQVNYAISATNLPTGTVVAGTALPGGYNFTVQNIGTANGSQTISYWIFLSPTAAPGSGMVLLQSGTAAAQNAGASTVISPLSWTWPSVPPVLPGPNRYIFIMIQAADDLTTANNTYTSPALTLAPPNIDYVVNSVSHSGGTQAGTAINGSFQLQNAGLANGSQNVLWTAYISTAPGAVIDGSAVVIDSGSTGSLSSLATQAVPFAGTWPSGSGTYYLKVNAVSADDVNTTNGIQVSPAYTTTNVDYIVSQVNNTGGLIAGAALGGNFVLTNSGSANGSQTVSYSVYASTTPTLGGGSQLVASGTTSQLNAGVSSGLIPFTGTWPPTAGAYYLIVAVSATDDVITGNNTLASGSVTVNPADVDYQVLSVTYTGGVTNPAGAVNGNIQIRNNGPNNGTQSVTWQIYASTNNTLDTSGTLIASGSTTPLANGASSSLISFSGLWPLIYGNYYLKAKVSVTGDVDTNSANDINVTGTTTAVGIYAEVEPNNNPALTDATVLPITLQPGMSVRVTGNMALADPYDIFRFNTGTAGSVTFSLSWGPSADATMYVVDSSSTILTGVGIGTATALAMSWSPVDLANTDRWLVIRNGIQPLYVATNHGAWTLIITAN